jgi:hypothetical protein
MPRLSRPRPFLVAVALLATALAAACGSSQVTPTGATSSAPVAIESAEAVASPSTGAGPSAAATGSQNPNAGASQGSIGEPDSPPPAGDPQQDEVCFAVLPAEEVGTALGSEIRDVVALGTDPSVSLTCTYTTANGGTLLATASAGDAAGAFQSALDLATGYGQSPVAIDGLGDQAFYAKAADRWPEQVAFTKGPVLVRLVNQTSATIGEVPFAALAASAADAIRAEIPPAP